jgi:hypothetical protein
MPASNVTKLRINNNLVGIVGLQGIMEAMARDFPECSDREIGQEILLRAAKLNYIPRRAEDAYGLALVREFRRFLGQDVDDLAPDRLQIIVLGPGCARCSQLERDVREVLTEMQLPGELIHVDDLREIARYGVMGAPALIINGKVVSVGSPPPRQQIKEWLREAEKCRKDK